MRGGGGGGGYKGTASGGGGGGTYVNPVATGVTQSVGVHTGNGQVTVAPAAIAKAFSYDGAVVQYNTIAVSGTYDIVAAGGQGGSNTLNSKTGGLAASSGGGNFLQAGAVLEIVVGGAGSNDAGRYGAGGGGGSFVIEINNGSPRSTSIRSSPAGVAARDRVAPAVSVLPLRPAETAEARVSVRAASRVPRALAAFRAVVAAASRAATAPLWWHRRQWHHGWQ